MTDENPHIRAAGEAFGLPSKLKQFWIVSEVTKATVAMVAKQSSDCARWWMEEDRWAKGPAVYLMVSAILGAMTGGVVIVLAMLR